MALAPVGRLKKSEINWLAKHKCVHSHSYLEHYSCYIKSNPLQQRIGFVDIETSNLSADYGIMFCYCILDDKTNKILHRIVTKKELEKNLDREVVKQCIKDLSTFDRVVTYYGSKFDLPFIRSRALYWGLDFPGFGQINHDDIYYTVKHKFRLSRSRMENACRTLLGSTEKNHINANYWIRALQGDKQSLDYILDHCRRDVRDLKRLHDKIIGFSRRKDSSI